MLPTTLHNWLGLATLALHLILVARLIYLEQERLWFAPEDGALIIVAQTALALLLIDGLYLSWALERPTRVVHHLAAFAPVITTLFFGIMINHSLVLGKGRRAVRHALALFTINTFLIFLAYWVSIGASMGWWIFPESWSNVMRR